MRQEIRSAALVGLIFLVGPMGACDSDKTVGRVDASDASAGGDVDIVSDVSAGGDVDIDSAPTHDTDTSDTADTEVGADLPCAAEETVCDGIDDDCDGEVDEGLIRRCGYGPGVCAAGEQTCQDGQWTACDALAVGELSEECDGELDEDCDGEVDNGCECVNESTQPCAVGPCDGEQVCQLGVYGECIVDGTAAEEEVCDDVDNDCDGEIDEGLVELCGSDEGVCERGESRCIDGVWSECAGDVGPSEETCNGLDDDCDGIVDMFSLVPGATETVVTRQQYGHVLIATATGYGVLSNTGGFAGELWFRFLDEMGAQVGDPILLAEDVDAASDAVWTDGGVLVSYVVDFDAAYTVRVEADGSVGEPIRVQGWPSQNLPVARLMGTDEGVTMITSDRGGPLRLRSLGPDGQPSNVGRVLDGRGQQPTAACDASRCLLAWSYIPGDDTVISFTRLDLQGRDLQIPQVLYRGRWMTSDPVVTVGHDGFAIAFVQFTATGTPYHIHFGRISQAGHIIQTPVVVRSMNTAPTRPELSASEQGYFLAWMEGTTVKVLSLDRQGHIIGETAVSSLSWPDNAMVDRLGEVSLLLPTATGLQLHVGVREGCFPSLAQDLMAGDPCETESVSALCPPASACEDDGNGGHWCPTSSAPVVTAGSAEFNTPAEVLTVTLGVDDPDGDPLSLRFRWIDGEGAPLGNWKMTDALEFIGAAPGTAEHFTVVARNLTTPPTDAVSVEVVVEDTRGGVSEVFVLDSFTEGPMVAIGDPCDPSGLLDRCEDGVRCWSGVVDRLAPDVCIPTPPGCSPDFDVVPLVEIDDGGGARLGFEATGATAGAVRYAPSCAPNPRGLTGGDSFVFTAPEPGTYAVYATLGAAPRHVSVRRSCEPVGDVDELACFVDAGSVTLAADETVFISVVSAVVDPGPYTLVVEKVDAVPSIDDLEVVFGRTTGYFGVRLAGQGVKDDPPALRVDFLDGANRSLFGFRTRTLDVTDAAPDQLAYDGEARGVLPLGTLDGWANAVKARVRVEQTSEPLADSLIFRHGAAPASEWTEIDLALAAPISEGQVCDSFGAFGLCEATFRCADVGADGYGSCQLAAVFEPTACPDGWPTAVLPRGDFLNQTNNETHTQSSFCGGSGETFAYSYTALWPGIYIFSYGDQDFARPVLSVQSSCSIPDESGLYTCVAGDPGGSMHDGRVTVRLAEGQQVWLHVDGRGRTLTGLMDTDLIAE